MDMNRFYDSNTRRFERLLSRHTDDANVLSVCNATIGILGVFYSLGLTNCEVITTPLTWAGALSGLKILNNQIVFAEIEEPTLTISPESIENLITSATKAIFTADFLGYPARLDAIKKICKKRNIILIHDAASSFGSMYKGKYSGYYADVCIYSFGRNKVFSTGEGGAIISKDDAIYEKLIFHLSHPERQDIQYDHYNPLALNTNMSPLSIKFGINRFNSLINNMTKHRDMVIKKLGQTNFFENWSNEMLPNFYKPAINTETFDAVQNFEWNLLPYQHLNNCGISDNKFNRYKIPQELCIA
jgi:dTDP-4-amino-4,6-dideoxygalactose transaminase